MMKIWVGSIVGLAFVCLSPAASAQTKSVAEAERELSRLLNEDLARSLEERASRDNPERTDSKDVDTFLDDVFGPRRKPLTPDPIWSGEGGLKPPSGATLTKHPGVLRAGDVIVEYPIAPSRTGRVTTAITLNDNKHGAYEIPPGTPVVAHQYNMIMVGSLAGKKLQQPPGSGWISWCTLGSAERGPVCIEYSGADGGAGVYTEYMAGGRIIYPSQQSGRSWRAALPVIEETPISPDLSATIRLTIATITDAGITTRLQRAEDAYVSPAPESRLTQFGSGIFDDVTLGGYAFRVERGPSPGTAKIEFVDKPR